MLIPAETRSGPSVPLMTMCLNALDAVLGNMDIPGRLAAVKIDVEGGEALVLRGAQKAIAWLRPEIAAFRSLGDCTSRFGLISCVTSPLGTPGHPLS